MGAGPKSASSTLPHCGHASQIVRAGVKYQIGVCMCGSKHFPLNYFHPTQFVAGTAPASLLLLPFVRIMKPYSISTGPFAGIYRLLIPSYCLSSLLHSLSPSFIQPPSLAIHWQRIFDCCLSLTSYSSAHPIPPPSLPALSHMWCQSNPLPIRLFSTRCCHITQRRLPGGR